ncbi:hypothetical protein GCM10009678_27220 [Actinomadura kijaniata]|uniref:Uncharacterized protein n=1 Tax=Actinomadura namibiensis TaxID=182080 RepID=A0A7W3LK68_ACTNM|nr:hypothetical protein [Actinomadura namibiensis]MBA8949655.1 hypothetical protein [Actinomadura namibiensis]
MRLDRFSPAARRTVVRAGVLAARSGHAALGTGPLLLALAEERPLPGAAAPAIRAELDVPPWRDRELLATIGIDLDEVRRRAVDATSTRPDDPALWRLGRSRLRPLRVVLTGPATRVVCDEGGRKTLEVALWAARRGGRAFADCDDLLWGLLADGSQESVRVLRRLDADLGRLWAGLRERAA